MKMIRGVQAAAVVTAVLATADGIDFDAAKKDFVFRNAAAKTIQRTAIAS